MAVARRVSGSSTSSPFGLFPPFLQPSSGLSQGGSLLASKGPFIRRVLPRIENPPYAHPMTTPQNPVPSEAEASAVVGKEEPGS